MRRRALTSFRALLAATVVFVSPVLAGTHTFTEDFTTTTYRDVTLTDAQWNTIPGNLKLWNHALNQIATEAVTKPQDVALQGPVVYVISNNATLQWFEVTIPTNPIPLGAVGGFASAQAVDVRGKYAYVADGILGLRVVDINAASIIGSWYTGSTAVNVTVAGDLAFLSQQAGGLEILDISNPAFPFSVGVINTPGGAYDAAVSGDYCYVADLISLLVVDISDPSTPGAVGSYTLSGVTNGVVVDGDIAYLSNTQNGLVAVDISDPTAPALLGSIPGVEGYSVAIAGNTAYLGRTSDVLQIDITNPAAPGPYNSLSTSGGSVFGLATNAEYVYATDYDNNLLRVLEALEPTPATVVGSVDPGAVQNVHIEGNVLYAAGGLDFYSIDVTDPSNPTPLDTLTIPTATRDFDVDGNYAFLASDKGGMYVVDVSDPTAMTIAGHLLRFGSQLHYAVAVHGDVAYLGGSGVSDQLHAVDISDPTSPSYVSTSLLADTPQDIFIVGNYAYIAVGAQGMDVVDISNPLSPSPVGNIMTNDNAHSVIVHYPIAYVTSDNDGVYVIDVSVPSTPGVITLLPLSGSTISGLAINGNYLFTSEDGPVAGAGGLRTYKITNPFFPVAVARGSTSGVTDPRRVVADGEYVYQATGADGIDVVHVFAQDFDIEDSNGASLAVDGTAEDVYAVKLNSQKTAADVTWLVSPDDATIWYLYPTEDEWFVFPTPDSDLRWYAHIEQAADGVNPTINQVDVTMAFAYPVINAINDIANDQGKQVRLTWQFSGLDAVGSPTPILNYAVYREIDPNLNSVATTNLVTAPEAMVATPAGWDFVGLVPATGDGEYSVVVPTLADSTIAQGDYQTMFYVRALTATPTTFFDSPPDSGYSLDNLSPGAPSGFLVAYNGSGNNLLWDDPNDGDFDYFRVYRSTDPNFTPTPGDVVHTTSAAGWADASGTGSHYYKVTAVDFSGNESDATGQTSTSAVAQAVPDVYALRSAVPNPFNPSTSIAYVVTSGGGNVAIVVYDAAGRRVRTLVSGDHEQGTHSTEWNGTDDRGGHVSSGVYFYRMTAPGFAATRKMLLLK